MGKFLMLFLTFGILDVSDITKQCHLPHMLEFIGDETIGLKFGVLLKADLL